MVYSALLTKQAVARCCGKASKNLNFTSNIYHERRRQQQQRMFASSSSSGGGGGAGIFQRIGSFLSGAGLTAILTQLYIYDELRQGNRILISKQKDLEARIAKLEK